ncbi:MAG: beta-phosphoglucomutase [Lachnospiraceae bacterium]|nr:beta-phosphoglucomutase [Lachnospiraceae bacterium]
MGCEAVIFDLDGVLVHTDRFHYLAWKQLSDERGIYFDEEINRRLRGVSRDESLEIILERYDGPALTPEEKKEMTEKKNVIYRGFLSQMTPADVTDEVRDTVRRIRKAGYRLAVGSSSKNTAFILDKTGLTGYFDEVADGTMITKTKPDPEVFLLAAEQLAVRPENCLIVEDAAAGIEAGKRAGMKTAAYGDAAKDRIADYDLEQFTDLLQILTIDTGVNV